MGRVAYVVSPHGFGHAARACAVMAEILRRRPEIHFDVMTEVPRWFFSESLPGGGFTYHSLDADVGLVQRSPLEEDLEKTIGRLDGFWNDDLRIRRVAEQLETLDCRLVVADIAPLALAAATAVSLPSVLVENFTWDWIYCSHPEAPSELRRHGRRLEAIFGSADLRIQAEPLCHPISTGVRVPPVARSSRRSRNDVRAGLGIPEDAPMVVVSMGGVPWHYRGFSKFELGDGPWVVVPGGSEAAVRRHGRLVLLPFHSEIYHPDLIGAADVVVSKLGYSTVAETYCAAALMVYVERPRFPESPVLARWVEVNMTAMRIAEGALDDGGWLEAASALLEQPRHTPCHLNGAERAAKVILEHFGSLFDEPPRRARAGE